MSNGRFLPEDTIVNTTGSGFLSTTDITDSLATDFVDANDLRVTKWLELVDGEILSVAQEKDVDLNNIKMPLHKKILEFAKCYYCMVCFQDTFGRNDINQGGEETIVKKLEYYTARVGHLRTQLTKEMFEINCSTLSANQRAAGTISVYRA
jgi:hypothetical protein